MMTKRTASVPHPIAASMLLLALLLVSGCQVPPPPAPAPSSTEQSGAIENEIAGVAVTAEGPVSADEASAPALLRIPAAEMEVNVTPLAWHVSEFDDQRTTIWLLPAEGAGWHPTSARAGTMGNVVIAGHQLLGDAAFAPIALGDVIVGQQVLLEDTDGRTFVYDVIDITEPLPISDDFVQERTLAAQIAGSSDEPLLTLVSGWPDYSSTHRVVVTAALVGLAE